MKKKKIIAAFSAIAVAMAALTGIVPTMKAPMTASAADAGIGTFTLADLTVTDGYCTNAFDKEVAYLLSLDTNRLLAGFRDNAGLSTNGASRYDGWENTLIGGHCVGHYLSAMAQAYQNPALDDATRGKIYANIKTMIDGMLICQQNSKGKPGFLWAATRPKNSSNVEQEFDNVEQGKTNIIDDAWVPWYTMHKLIAGLNDVCKMVGYEPAETVARGLGDWTYNRTSGWSADLNARVLGVEYGGMNDCLYDLYEITGEEKYAVAAHRFDETALFERVLAGGTDVLNNRHANTTIPKFVGALQRYTVLHGKTIGGETVDASKYLRYAEAFWEMVKTHHTYITGGNSEWEHFGKDDVLDGERTNCNCETCNSYNMLKLSRALFSHTGDKKYMDYYENTYYNSILSSQNPETGMTTYFQPMATGYFKTYSTPTNKFWCCTGSGMENFSKLGDTIYMHRGNTLFVNIYQSSAIRWEEQGVTITQESSIPAGDTVEFTVTGSGSLDLRFRIPDWIAGNMAITKNGETASYETVDGYAQLKGDFADGDVIMLKIPVTVRAYSLPDNTAAYAFKYGPLVLSAELGTASMKEGNTGMWVTTAADKIVASEKINIDEENGTVGEFMADIASYLVRDGDSLKFRLNGTNTALTFSPHYLQYQQRYGIYWYFYPSGASADKEDPRAKITVVDTVQPGYGQYENDALHDMQEHNTVSVTNDSTYRYAEAGGSFTYRMAVDPSAPMNMLQMTLRKADNGKTLCVAVGGNILYKETLNYTGGKDTYNVRILIPADIIAETSYSVEAYGATSDVVEVTFCAADENASARVCDFIYTQAVKPLYEFDSKLAYFVDCGDHNRTTVTGSDKFGLYNSRTEQIAGTDEVSGMYWGLVDDPTDQYAGSGKSKGLYTANTWPDEYNVADGRDKTSSFRYTKNQYENDIDRHIDYTFSLPNGTYDIEVGFANPWSCSENPIIYANYGTDDQAILAENISVGSGTSVKAKATVKNGKLTLNFRTADKAINVTYISIAFGELAAYEKLDLTETPTAHRGDVDCNGEVELADAVLMAKSLAQASGISVSAQGRLNGDLNDKAGIDDGDLTLLLQYISGALTTL